MKRLLLIVMVIAFNSCQSDSCLESLKKADINLNIRSKEEFENGKMLKAIKTNDEAIRLNPNNFIALSNRGVFRYNLYKEKGKLGKYSKSKIMSDLTMAVKLCPKYRISLRNLIRVAYNLKEFEVIVNYSEEYNIRFEKSGELLSRLGDAYWEIGDYEKGVQVIDEAVQIEPIFDYAYVVRGKCYYKLGKYDQAIRDFSEALERNDTFSLAYHERGVCYLKKKDYELATQQMYESIRIDSNRVEPYYSLGIIHVDKENMAKACKYFDLARIKYYQNNDLVKFESWEDRIDRAIEKYCNYN